MGDATVSCAAHGDGLVLGPAVDIADEVLGAGLSPPDRPAVESSQLRHHDLFLGSHPLGTEAAADIGDNHPDVVRIEAECSGHIIPVGVGALAAGPAGQPGVFVGRGGHSGLNGNRSDPGVDQVGLDDHLAVDEVDGRAGRLLPADVVVEVVEQEGFGS